MRTLRKLCRCTVSQHGTGSLVYCTEKSAQDGFTSAVLQGGTANSARRPNILSVTLSFVSSDRTDKGEPPHLPPTHLTLSPPLCSSSRFPPSAHSTMKVAHLCLLVTYMTHLFTGIAMGGCVDVHAVPSALRG